MQQLEMVRHAAAAHSASEACAVDNLRRDFEASWKQDCKRAENKQEGLRQTVSTLERELRVLRCSQEAAGQAAAAERVNERASLRREMQRETDAERDAVTRA